MVHLGSRATSTTEKGERKSLRWEGRSRTWTSASVFQEEVARDPDGR
jgi:hypothetical protein